MISLRLEIREIDINNVSDAEWVVLNTFKEPYEGREVAGQSAHEARESVGGASAPNAASNEPMLKIDHEMGFKPGKSYTMWQIDLPGA